MNRCWPCWSRVRQAAARRRPAAARGRCRPACGCARCRQCGARFVAGDLKAAAHGVRDLNGAIVALRATLAAGAAVPTPIERSRARPEMKQARVLAMLARVKGASGPQIAEAMGWAPHTVRGFLARRRQEGNHDRGPRACPSARHEQARRRGQLHRISPCGRASALSWLKPRPDL
jgi:hypothetical protein